MEKHLIVFILFFYINDSFAHKEFTITEDYGNVKVLFTTGFNYEEINKALIIGRYSEVLSKKLNYENQITLWFRHDYINNYKKKYTLNHNDDIEKSKANEIFIKLVDYEYNVSEILKLLEYAILNISKINNLDGTELVKSFNKESKTIQEVLNKKIYRPKSIEKLSSNSHMSYFYQKNKFNVYRLEDGVENVLKKIDNIFQIHGVNNDTAYLFFDSRNSFLYLKNNESQKLLDDKIVLKNTEHPIARTCSPCTHNTFRSYNERTRSSKFVTSKHNKKREATL